VGLFCLLTSKNRRKSPADFRVGGMERRFGEIAALWCDDDVRLASIDAAQHHL
jgi:hypothetical protein